MRLTTENEHYMRMDLTPYLGEWIAIQGREVIAHARSFSDVHSTVSDITDPSKVLFAPVPETDSLIVR